MTQTLMVVDDESEIRDLLRQIITTVYKDRVASGELVVRVAADGADAVDQSRLEPPALILMDVVMPSCDGIDAFYRIKLNNDNTPVKTVFMTGFSGDPVLAARIKTAIADGALCYLVKPVRVAELRKVIDQFLAG